MTSPVTRFFLDANILFTAALSPDGRSASRIKLAEEGKCELITSPHALAEARRNLKLKKPGALARLEEEILVRVGIVAESGPEAARIGMENGLPLKDAPILSAAIQASVSHLVTGDARHFGHLYGRKIGGLEVVTPMVALEAVLSAE